jgi:hypothetical protein
VALTDPGLVRQLLFQFAILTLENLGSATFPAQRRAVSAPSDRTEEIPL